MTKISEMLTLDLQEDIKNVIDLEDRSEAEIQQEIEAYIVTEGIGLHLYSFTNHFTSNIKETGVWLSGFYGSGKSYFGKMLGYIIDNPTIHGTPARERFIPRLKGISDQGLVENAIRKLDAINSRVVFLDVAKQNTERGLAFTLFANFLKNLGFRDCLSSCNWNNLRPDLREDLAHLVNNIKRRVCGIASAGFPLFSV